MQKKQISFGLLLSFFALRATALPAPHLVISIPKSGTHLLLKCIGLLINNFKYEGCKGFTKVNQHQISTTKSPVLASHALHIPHNVATIAKNKLRTLFIYRDPRDQIVSKAYWVKKYPKIWPAYQNKTIEEIILELIVDGSKIYTAQFEGKQMAELSGINDLYELYMPWSKNEYVLPVKFEDLIGPNGNGSKEQQLETIKAIANHLGLSVSAKQIENAANKLFGTQNSTSQLNNFFNKGIVGRWKTHFTQEHKEKFKAVAGNLLISLGYENNFNW